MATTEREIRDNDVINAVKRLERIGDENSQQVTKLKTAVIQVAQAVCDAIPTEEPLKLPGGFRVEFHDGKKVLVMERMVGDWFILNVGQPGQLMRRAALDFAREVADGIITRIADAVCDEFSFDKEFGDKMRLIAGKTEEVLNA
jgi:hypothetical protein